MSVEIKTNIPANKADTIAQVCKNLGATSVQKVPQADGSVTLIVVYPDADALVAASVAGGTS